METFMGKNTRRGFTHIGSLVYTPRPSKDGPASKVVTPTSLKSSRPLKRFDEADDPPHWVEQLDLLRRLDGCHDNEDEDDADADHGVLPNAVQNNVGEADLLGLQSEIVESKEELWKMDSVEQGICYSDVQGLEMVAEVQENAEGDKDEELPYVHKELQEKQNEPVEIKPLLQDAEDADLRTDENGMHSEEAKEIQPEITSLKFQLKVAIHEFIRATCLSVACSLEQGVDDHRPTMLNHEEKLEGLETKEYYDHDETAKEMEYIEMLKRQYFAALIAAREKPCEETLALAAELRERLKSVLAIPSFSSFGQ